MDPRIQTIIEYFSNHEFYKCGYCKSPDTNYSHGIWAHQMTPEVYQNLINRGWRRSGKYVYKPANSIICCPMYTISQKASDFTLSQSQKKVLKRFNNFLHTGELKKSKETGSGPDNDQDMSSNYHQDSENVTHLPQREGQADQNDIQIKKLSSLSPSKSEIKASPSQEQEEQLKLKLKTIKEGSCDNDKDTSSSTEIRKKDCDKKVKLEDQGPCKILKKAKELRIERKKAKLIAQGLDPSVIIKGPAKHEKKSIEDFIQPDESAKSKLIIKLIKVNSREFKKTIVAEHKLYQKYQMEIHNDSESECSPDQFKRFLVDSPLNEVENEEEDIIYGSYHQQYFVNDVLIAVGVIDILPSCVSSVYFFYDPEYMSLTLGTYGALREIEFVRKLNKSHENIRYYYLGFYIHSCKKMRYKGNFAPSYLLCPEKYTWHLLDTDLRDKLSQTKYLRLDPSPKEDSPRDDDINQVKIMNKRAVITYELYKSLKGEHDRKEIQDYVNLVGEKTAELIILYRN